MIEKRNIADGCFAPNFHELKNWWPCVTINLQLTQEEKYARMEYVFLKDAIHHVVQDGNARIEYVFLKDALHRVVQDWDAMQIEYVFLFRAQ